MNKDLNHVTIIGRLVRDPEIKYTPSGTAMTIFSIANNDLFISNNDKKEHVNFFDTVVWGNQAVNCEKYLKKGSQVAIEGYLRQNRWTDQNGQNRSKIEIIAIKVQFLSLSGKSSNTEQFSANQKKHIDSQQPNLITDPWKDINPLEDNDNDNDIPF